MKSPEMAPAKARCRRLFYFKCYQAITGHWPHTGHATSSQHEAKQQPRYARKWHCALRATAHLGCGRAATIAGDFSSKRQRDQQMPLPPSSARWRQPPTYAREYAYRRQHRPSAESVMPGFIDAYPPRLATLDAGWRDGGIFDAGGQDDDIRPPWRQLRHQLAIAPPVLTKR